MAYHLCGKACVGPESIARGFFRFFWMRGEMFQIPLKAGHHRPPAKHIKMEFSWWANLECWLGSFVFIQGIWTSIEKHPIFL